MAADDLAPCIARSSAAMLVLTMQYEHVPVSQEEGLQLCAPSQFWERNLLILLLSNL